MILPEVKKYRIPILKIFLESNEKDQLKWITDSEFFSSAEKLFTDKDNEFHIKRLLKEKDWLIQYGYLLERKNGGGEIECQINHVNLEKCENLVKTPFQRFKDKHLFTIIYGLVLAILAVMLDRLIPNAGK